MTPSSVLSACKALPTHGLTTFSPTCHPDPIFSAPVPGMLWARYQQTTLASGIYLPLFLYPPPPSSQPLSAFRMASFKKTSFGFKLILTSGLGATNPLGSPLAMGQFSLQDFLVRR